VIRPFHTTGLKQLLIVHSDSVHHETACLSVAFLAHSIFEESHNIP